MHWKWHHWTFLNLVVSPTVSAGHVTSNHHISLKIKTSSCFVTPNRCQCERTLTSQLACWITVGNARDYRVFSDSCWIKYMLLYIYECVCACVFTCECVKGKLYYVTAPIDRWRIRAASNPLFSNQLISLFSTPPVPHLHTDLLFLLSALLILFVLSFLLRIGVFWKRQLEDYAPLIPYPQSNLPTDHWTLSLSVCVVKCFLLGNYDDMLDQHKIIKYILVVDKFKTKKSF